MQNSTSKNLKHLRGPDKPCLMSDHLAQVLAVSKSRVLDWLSLGAAYLNENRIAADIKVDSADQIRVYTDPRRFSSLPLPISKYVHVLNTDFLVAIKPPGSLTHASADNAKENLLSYLSEEYGPLWPVQRLDLMTAGLIVFERTLQFAKNFQIWNRQKRVTKIYQAWISKSLSVGTLKHHMLLKHDGFRAFVDLPEQGSKVCELNVLTMSPTTPFGYQATVQLVTGRTHQIRGQLAAAGSPLVGDFLYGSTRKAAPLKPSLICTSIILPRGRDFIQLDLPYVPFSVEIEKRENS